MNFKKKSNIALVVCLVATSSMFFSPIAKEVYAQTPNITINNNEEEAKKIALEKTNGGAVIVFETEDYGKVFEIKIINGDYLYSIDMYSEDYSIYKFKKTFIGDRKFPSSSDIGIESAKKIALENVDSATVIKSKSDYDYGRKIYEIELITDTKKHEFDIGAGDSFIYEYGEKTITTAPNKVITSTETSSNQTTSNIITAEKAKEIALEKTGGGTVVNCKKDYEHNTQIYEVEIKKDNMEYELDIRASDGFIMDYDVDYYD